MQLKVLSINVDDQSKGLEFYNKVLGSTKTADFTSVDYRWLAVPSHDGIEGVEPIRESLAFHSKVRV